jgi:serine/threonine protein kinase
MYSRSLVAPAAASGDKSRAIARRSTHFGPCMTPSSSDHEPNDPPVGPPKVAHDAPTLPPEETARLNEATLDWRPAPAERPAAPAASPASSAEAIEARPVRFGDYELLATIARGGMGIVYKARQVRLNRIVALKMILAGQFATEEDVQRFVTEAVTAAGVDHPGIVPIFEVGEYQGQHFFSMGFIDGESLAARLARGPLPPKEAADLVRKIAEAVQFAHERGVIHRDLKPANVMLQGPVDGDVASLIPKVTDFGLAKRLAGDSNLTDTGQILGTPNYMPPEQAAGRVAEVRETADVYSLGAILYAALTGRPPFQAASRMDTLLQVLESDPAPPRTLNPAVARDLEIVTLKCLAKEPQQRYASARALADDLQRFIDDEPILARPLGPLRRFRRWTKRRPILSGCLVSLLGLILFLTAVGTLAACATVWANSGIATFEDRKTPAFTFPAAVAQPGESELIQFDQPGLHELQAFLSIETPSWEYDGQDNLQPHFNFPVSYEVETAAGQQLAAGKGRVVWNASMRHTEGYTKVDNARSLATTTPGAAIGYFRTTGSERVRIRWTVHPDEQYDAHIAKAEIRVYENVRDMTTPLVTGTILCAISPPLLLAGILLAVYGPFLMAQVKRI